MYHKKKYKSIKLATLVNERGEQLQFRSSLSFQCLNKSDHNSYATGCVGIKFFRQKICLSLIEHCIYCR